MKQAEIVADRLIELANEVRSKNRNAAHAKVEAEILQIASTVAYKQSLHMNLQKKKPQVKFFDSNVVIQTPEQKVTTAAKTLAKQSTKARVAKG
jgi:hypothetical protein